MSGINVQSELFGQNARYLFLSALRESEVGNDL